MDFTTWIVLSLTNLVGAVVYLIHEYDAIPQRIAMQFSLKSEPSYYTPKCVIFGFPALIAVLAILFHMLPRWDSLKENYAYFRGEYNLFSFVMQGFLTYTMVLIVLWNERQHNVSDILRWMTPAFAVLMFVCGLLQSKVRRNHFVGVRTAWALRSDENWAEANGKAAFVFYVSGVLCLLGVLDEWIFVGGIAVLLLGLAGITVYAYLKGRREQEARRTD